MTASPSPESSVPETSVDPVVTETAVPEYGTALTESDREDDRPVGENPPPPSPELAEPIVLTEVLPDSEPEAETAEIQTELTRLTEQKEALEAEVAALQSQRDGLAQEIQDLQSQLGRMVRIALEELQDRKRDLRQAIEQLEQRQERIQTEMRQNFAGVSQDLAIRVKSFKDYLVGSLQELVVAAEDLNLVPPAPVIEPVEAAEPPKKAAKPAAGSDEGFKAQARDIRRLLDQYRTSPDYYGPAWQLRRTFEPIHAERVNNWFFEQGGRGAIRGLGTRSQNILVASAIISVLTEFYGEQLVTLVLANTPESLGEWRRGLQDCLGISRADFGPNQGIALYEDPDPLVQKADQLMQARDFPLVIIDEAEALIDLSLLQFPLWLAFVSDPRRQSQWV
ncbi:MAG: DUF3086 domain-containing protein [Prochlorotrichaceae cyanobacterium]